MSTELEQAQAAVLQAQARHSELEQAAQVLRAELPRAEQALTAARERLKRAKRDAATVLDAHRAAELQSLTAAIAAAKGGHHV